MYYFLIDVRFCQPWQKYILHDSLHSVRFRDVLESCQSIPCHVSIRHNINHHLHKSLSNRRQGDWKRLISDETRNSQIHSLQASYDLVQRMIYNRSAWLKFQSSRNISHRILSKYY
jgi:hypothetical protein